MSAIVYLLSLTSTEVFNRGTNSGFDKVQFVKNVLTYILVVFIFSISLLFYAVFIPKIILNLYHIVE